MSNIHILRGRYIRVGWGTSFDTGECWNTLPKLSVRRVGWSIVGSVMSIC